VQDEYSAWYKGDTVCDVLFWIDLPLNFFFTYQDALGGEVRSLRLIALRYLRTDFTLNLIAALPSDLIRWLIESIAGGAADGFQGDPQRAVRLLRLQSISRMARLLRVLKLIVFNAARCGETKFIGDLLSSRSIRVCKFFAFFLWTVHLLACGWYLVAWFSDDPSQTWLYRRILDSEGTRLIDATPYDQWLHAMYFMLTICTTVGFGDVVPISNAEVWYVFAAMVAGTVLQGYIISHTIAIMTSENVLEEYVARQLELVRAFAAHTQLPEESSFGMEHWVKLNARAWMRQKYDKEEMKVLITGNMPGAVLETLPDNIFGGLLQRNAWFKVIQRNHQKFALGSCSAHSFVVPSSLTILVALAGERH
ncbi:unnamed protein product, partial [Polarella glacialis]